MNDRRVNRLDERIGRLEQQVATVTAKVDTFIGEMRDRDNQRAQDIREIRNSLDGMGKHVRNLTVATMVGMGSMTIAGIAVAISIFLK
ncbi:MAG: hypothetical protein II968_04345 [Selenomonadaceae bacterium]|nr:hypothetical protein [Selenomonadaceae bacterium]MBQ6758281.1 hypothetical protein [Selenomonadaceae bacterium]